jgi:pimeloyl-ACP methyl ester carboxylesterase
LTLSRITSHGLFTDIRGAADAPPLLFLHGGPGQGCYEFMALQGDRQASEAGTLRHHRELSGSDAFFEPVLPLLAELRCPGLLITGALDPITSGQQREAFHASPTGQSARFPHAGHFVHADEPGAYA